MPQKITRRNFLVLAAVAGGGLAFSDYRQLLTAPSDRVRVGVILANGNAGKLIEQLGAIPSVEIVACSYANGITKASALSRDTSSGLPAVYSDWRKLLDRKDIDVLSINDPHANQVEIAMLACAAGKDVLLDQPGRAVPQLARLSNAAQADKRLVGHIYKTQFLASKADVPFSSIDKLKVARAQRFVIASGKNGEALSDTEERRSEFIFGGVEELDYARAVLDVATPLTVSCVAMQRSDRPEILRATARFEFATAAGDCKTIEIDSRALAQVNRSNQNPSIVFGGDRCGFALNSKGDFSDEIWKATWSNFLDSVRSRRPTDLMAPISEYASTLKLLSLADRSLISGQTIRGE